MSNPDTHNTESQPISFQVELDYDFLNVPPIAVNSTLVGGISGEIIIDCLFINPFTLGQKAKPSKKKGFDDVSNTNNPVKIKALPMARLMITPTSAMALMKQLQAVLEQQTIVEEDATEEEKDE
jgi:hypothetical protein